MGIKKIIFFVFVFSVFAQSAHAALPVPVLISFGGRVITAPIPGAVCATSLEPTSPFAIKPFGTPYIGPFASVPGPQTSGQVIPGAQILGLFLSIPVPDCTAPVPPLGTFPVFKAPIYGTDIPIDDPV